MSRPVIRVVLADDHAIVRKGMRELLEESGMTVVGEAADGLEAVELALALQPDLVLMDVRMPLLTGIEATRRIRADAPQIKVLVLTAYDDQPYVFALLDAGAQGYILKTADADAIVRAVREVARGGTSLDPQIVPVVVERAMGRTEAPTQPLSDREREVLQLAARGLTNKQIGVALSISDRTVQNHLQSVFEKLHVRSRTEAVTAGLRDHLIVLDETV